jgi:hypothetical protein
MFERLASVNQCIKNVFVVGIESFGYDSDDLLKNAPDALGNGELDNPIGRFVKEPSDGLIGDETFDCAQNVVLKYGERYAGNLGREVPGLGFPKSEQALSFLEEDFNRPSF